jgi:hypothetical protein
MQLFVADETTSVCLKDLQEKLQNHPRAALIVLNALTDAKHENMENDVVREMCNDVEGILIGLAYPQ